MFKWNKEDVEEKRPKGLPKTMRIDLKEEDLEKVKYIFGPFKDEDIKQLREEAGQAKKIAEKYNLIQVGGWKGWVNPGLQVDPGVMGCDAMAWLSGFEDIMILSLTNPDIVIEYCNIIHEWNMKQIEIYLDVTDADLIIRRAWYETTEFWTPQAYKSIIAPILKKEVDLIDLNKASTVFKIQIIKTGKLIYNSNNLKKMYFQMRTMKDYAILNEERQEIIDKIKSRGARI